MKKLLIVIAAFVLVLLVGCDSTPSEGCVESDEFEFGKIEVERTLFDTDIKIKAARAEFVKTVNFISFSAILFATSRHVVPASRTILGGVIILGTIMLSTMKRRSSESIQRTH